MFLLHSSSTLLLLCHLLALVLLTSGTPAHAASPIPAVFPVEDYPFDGSADQTELINRGWTVVDSDQHQKIDSTESTSKWIIDNSNGMVQDQVMVGVVSPHHEGTLLRRPLTTGWSDVDVETSLKLNRGANPGATSAKEGTIGLIFRVTNDHTYYRAYFSTWSDTLVLDRMVDSQQSTLSTVNLTTIANNVEVKLKIRAVSSRITVFVNDQNTMDIIDPVHEKTTGSVGLYVSGTLASSSFDYLRVSPPPSLLMFTRQDGTVSNNVHYGVPYAGFAQGNDIAYRVKLAYCGPDLSSSGDDGLWIRVILDDPHVAALVHSPLLYVGCGTVGTAEANVHNLVVVRPNVPGQVVLNHVTKDNGDEINQATRGTVIVAIDTTATPLVVKTLTPHYLQPGDTIRLIGLHTMPLLNGKAFQVGKVVADSTASAPKHTFELKGIGPTSVVNGNFQLGVYGQKNNRWMGQVLSDMSTVHIHVARTQPGPPSPKSVEGVFPSGHVTIAWDPPAGGYDGSPLPCAEDRKSVV